MLTENIKRPYRGRFAPSPSGPLHFGSLVTALASYIHAKQHQGTWLVRIEDIDPPREQQGAASLILKTLAAFGLHSDEPVLYQSQQSDKYNHLLATLAQQKLTYHCQCTRANIKAIGGIYQGYCRDKSMSAEQSAIRLINQFAVNQFDDLFQSPAQNKAELLAPNLIQCDQALAQEDFILRRKDGLFAYQLAVVHDDIEQKISHIIRGCDLLEPTARQLTLFKTLNCPAPTFGHIPLAVTETGFKLSKQNKAPALDLAKPQPILIKALHFLGQTPAPELSHGTVEEIINWAVCHSDFNRIPKQPEIIL
ncbi:MAG: tRNA glutamyl-Q(34) synthetase GluQRS [Thalassotalea sp.]